MSGLRVLLVEDYEPDAELIQRRLLATSLDISEVVCKGSRAEAIEYLSRHAVDLILLDLKLPNGSGLEVVRDLRRSPVKVPSIVLTGVAREGDEFAAARAGVQGFIGKNDLTTDKLDFECRMALARHASRMEDIEIANGLSILRLNRMKP